MNSSNRTAKLTFTALMVALTVVLAMTPLGMIRLPIIALTISHIPTLVAAMVLGLSSGVITGLSFGLVSMFIAITAPVGITDPLFANPLISVLPRVFIGVATYHTYNGVTELTKGMASKKTAGFISAAAGAVAGNLMNGIGVLGMLALVYGDFITENLGKAPLAFVTGVLASSTIFETIATAIIVTPLVFILKKVYKAPLKGAY